MSNFKVGDKVWAKSCSGDGSLYEEGSATIKGIRGRFIEIMFHKSGKINDIGINHPNYEYDEIRPLTKLDKILS